MDLHGGIPHTLTLPFPLPRIIPVTPVGPGLPGHRSIRPYTVFELEQVRQQSRKYGQRSPARLCRGGSGRLEGEGRAPPPGGTGRALERFLSSPSPSQGMSVGAGRVKP